MLMSGACGGIRTSGLRLTEKPFFRSITRRRQLFASSCSVSRNREKVIVISGPTGAGKSRLALELAKRLNGEIISADSVQVYRGLDVGSAKPSLSDRRVLTFTIKISAEELPHHLIDILHPSEDYSAGQFFEDARETTKDILNKGRVPIVTGGTGLYLRWFIYGKPDVPKASPEIAAEVYSELADLQRDDDWDTAVELVVKAGDPKARSLAANDWYRLRRSLEIIRSTGSPPSTFQIPYDSFREQSDSSETVRSHDRYFSAGVPEQNPKELDYDFSCFFLSSQRLDLYRSIDLRCEDMLSGKDGILSEARWLLDTGLLPNSNSATRAIGYRQAMEYLLRCREKGGRSSTGEFYSFLSEFQKASRNFAKRQMTWFRNERIYQWLNASRPLESVLDFIIDSYHDQTGTLSVRESLQMRKDMRSRREVSELKAYRPRNRHFISREDCSDLLDWIMRTQGETCGLQHPVMI